MPYALSFEACFFHGDGSPPPDDMQPSDHPTCVYQALLSLLPHDWAALARDVFRTEPTQLDIDTVIRRIIETNTCTSLESPTEIWIDRAGWYRITVFDSTRTGERRKTE